MYRADPHDVASLDRLVDLLRDERDFSPDPSPPPTRGSVLRWLVDKEVKARGIVVPSEPLGTARAPRRAPTHR